MPKKQWYEIEVRDDLSAHAIDCPDCKGREIDPDFSGYYVTEVDHCQTCMGYGRVNEFDWITVAKVKSKGLANIVFNAMKAHYRDRVRFK